MEKNSSNISKLVFAAIISSFFTIITSFVFYYFTTKEPFLKYEVQQISNFKKDSNQITIIKVKIINDGKKECEGVTFNPCFGDSNCIVDCVFERIPGSIVINKMIDSSSKKILYFIPYLNPHEQIFCTFLVKRIIDEEHVDIDLRSKGINGVRSGQSKNGVIVLLFLVIIITLCLTIGLIAYIIFYQRKIIKNLQGSMYKRDGEILFLERTLHESGIKY